ncbi:MAG: hypothetical protein K6G83_14215 [Lachnospiraceae bacterium]|nr:hypothetical protein [Lachnospiraceae bacterium]
MESKNVYDTIRSDLKEIERRLIQSYQSGDMTENDFRNLLELTRIVLNKECDGLDNTFKEGLVNAMGGHIIELQTDREQRYEQTIAKSEEERRKLQAERSKLQAESSKLQAESSKLQAERSKLQAENEKLSKEIEELKAALEAALQAGAVPHRS